ncbi:unnamed protein product [Paramecium octaurelia]|nr:unnamed protein product [Paramecium octaurelia]CAD8215240.1 unnamed protein product [Paramecium octaurelia]
MMDFMTNCGEYKNDKKVAIWNIEYEGYLIQVIKINGNSGGEFYYEGIKNGNQIELDDGFYICKQLIYSGEYNNGKKVGNWCNKYNGQLLGGSYYEVGKVGEWIELDDGFSTQKQVTYRGEQQNSKKVGRWNIQGNMIGIRNIESYNVVGSYDEGIKVGKCNELDDKFYLKK